MGCEKTTEQSGHLESGPEKNVLSNSSRQHSSDNGNQSNLIPPSKITACSIKDRHGQPSVAGKGVPYYPISNYNYIYPGYNGAFIQRNDSLPEASYSLFMDMERAYSSAAYCGMPGYALYADGLCVGQVPYFLFPGYLFDPTLYGKEAMASYSWGQVLNDTSNRYSMLPGLGKYSAAQSISIKPDGCKTAKSYRCGAGDLPTKPLETKPCQTFPFSSTSCPNSGGEPCKPFYKVSQPGYHLDQSGLINFYCPTRTSPSIVNEKKKFVNGGGSMGRRVKGRMWNSSSRFQLREFNGRDHYEASDELRCGPRANKWKESSDFSSENTILGSAGLVYESGAQEFQVAYDSAKFYVIKSYSEDDVHKCIKYSVWSSTSDGNKKLDAAFCEAEAKANKLGKTCPIFLFFSVNGSGQFVGLAEMTGRVDFNKDKDFWQLDKWSGFFTVKWHIVKDIPNSHLRHILLESNENRPVTYSRDTQEIELKPGLDMLKIFKDYLAKSSIFDDFDFYENREKKLQARKGHKLAACQTDMYSNDLLKHADTTEGGQREDLSKRTSDQSNESPKLLLSGGNQNSSINSCE